MKFKYKTVDTNELLNNPKQQSALSSKGWKIINIGYYTTLLEKEN